MMRKKVLIMIVGVVLAVILAALTIKYFSPLTDGSDMRQRATKSTVQGIGAMLYDYQKKHGRFPSTEDGLKLLYPEQSSDKDLKDSWGRPFAYRARPAEKEKPFKLYSLGENGIDEGGSGDDIDYWSIARK